MHIFVCDTEWSQELLGWGHGALGAFSFLYPSPSLSFSLSSPLSPLLWNPRYASWTSSQTVTTRESCLLKRCYYTVVTFIDHSLNFTDILNSSQTEKRDTQYHLLDWSTVPMLGFLNEMQCNTILPVDYNMHNPTIHFITYRLPPWNVMQYNTADIRILRYTLHKPMCMDVNCMHFSLSVCWWVPQSMLYQS